MSTEGVDKGHHQWLQAMETNDPAALGRLVTAEVVLMPPHSEAVAGRQGVVDWFAGVVAHARTKAVGVPRREVMLAGDLAIERGSFTWRVAPAAGGSDVEDQGNFVAVWQRQPEDSWKVVRLIWNSTLPLPALT